MGIWIELFFGYMVYLVFTLAVVLLFDGGFELKGCLLCWACLFPVSWCWFELFLIWV